MSYVYAAFVFFALLGVLFCVMAREMHTPRRTGTAPPNPNPPSKEHP